MSSTLNWFHHDGNRLLVWLGPPVVNGEHAMTPDSVRVRYKKEIVNASLVMWSDQALGLFGLKSGTDEMTWHSAKIEQFIIEWCRPAKAGGHVALFVRTQECHPECFALHSTSYSDESLNWFRILASTFESWFPGRTAERDIGYDA